MTEQLSLESKIFDLKDQEITINGLSSEQFSVFFNNFLSKSERLNFSCSTLVFQNESQAEDFYQLIKKEKNVVFYPGLGSEIYSSIIPSEKNLFDRFNVLNQLIQNKKSIIITTLEASRLIVPDKSFFKNNVKVEVSEIISPLELSQKLVSLGYHKTISVEEPGTFSNRGEIFDIYPVLGNPIRLYYFDDMIEEIFEIDQITLKTLRDSALESFTLTKTPHSLLDDELSDNFKSKLPRPSPGEKDLYDYKKNLTSKVNNKQLFEDYPLFVSYFFNERYTLFDYLDRSQVFLIDEFRVKEASEELDLINQKSFDEFNLFKDGTIKPDPSEIYGHLKSKKNIINVNSLAINQSLDANDSNILDLNIKGLDYFKDLTNKSKNIDNLLLFITHVLKSDQKIYFLCPDKKTKEEIEYILETKIEIFSKKKNNITYLFGLLSSGFTYVTEQIHFISSSDFFGKKQKKAKKRKEHNHGDLFAEQLATLETGDYVIHKDYGVGQYLGIESLELSGNTSDYIVLSYQDNDKVYVPVYRLNLLQKYATNQTSVTVANLKSKKFELLKSKAKKSVKKLAFDLIELQARRKMKKSFSFSAPDHNFNDFAQSFKFEETPDQAQAIEDVLQDMQSERPMDRLVCGDVGFGKTEVAMRASYLCVLDNKQVCILVPTTVLCLQHYNSFVERFAGTPVVIDSLSRFKTAKQSREILEKLEAGKIDIIIGTHKLLSEKIKYHDLGLVVVDEEQRFGVGHKEKLKLIRESVDTLTLTATPIPRTLQLSFLGIKELSLIKTAPPRRQSIKTYIVKEDMQTIKHALEKELSRDGQIFIVSRAILMKVDHLL